MAEKQAILRGLINGIAHELLPKTDIYSVWLDEDTNLAEKLAEVINSLNGKVTPDQMNAAIEAALEGLDIEAPSGSAVTPDEYSGTDTQRIRQALENNRRVFIPGGNYYLDGEIVIRDNCQLELAQDAVLYFTNTYGNCISMKQSAYLKGNHATVSVPYAFAGNVINVDTSLSSAVNECPPFIKWDPQWKTGRYITDLNIVKPDNRGFYYSVNGDANGTAVYVCTDSADVSRFMWGINFSGLRIAGAFSYGIRAQNYGTAYNHEMRVEAIMDACEIGVSLENVNNAYISAIVQPRVALTTAEQKIPYAKHGIQLINSRNTDLSGSRVWDWNESTCLWTAEGIYQHISMTGNCHGTILNDFFYYELPQYDIRDLIYTDTPSNLEKITILQEPFTRWFKPIDNKPYFFNGDMMEELVRMKELNSLIKFENHPTFSDVLPTATDENGNVFNGTGYMKYGMWEIDGKTLTPTNWLGCTGYIPCKAGQVIRVKGIKFINANDYSRIIMLDANHIKLHHVNHSIFTTATYYLDYVETEEGFEMTVKPAGACVDTAYIKLNFPMAGLTKNPVIAIDQEIGFEYSGYLAEGIKVRADQIVGET